MPRPKPPNPYAAEIVLLFIEALRQTHRYHVKVNPGSELSGLPQTREELKLAYIVFRSVMSPHLSFSGISPAYAVQSCFLCYDRSLVSLRKGCVKYSDSFFVLEPFSCFENKYDDHLNESMFRKLLHISVPAVIKDISTDDLQTAFSKAAVSDLGPIENSAVMPVFLLSKQASVTFNIKNMLTCKLDIDDISALHGKVDFKFTHPDSIAPGSTAAVKATFTPSTLGQCRFMISFDFDNGTSIRKWVTLRIIRPEFRGLMDDLKPKSKFYRRVYRDNKASRIVPGVRPETYRSVSNKLKPLKHYRVTEEFRKQVKTYRATLAKPDHQDPDEFFANGALSQDNYEKFFHACLNLEELQMNRDIRTYDMDDAVFAVSGDRKYLTLDVPGLAENRPSVVYGDKIFATKTQDPQNTRYEGFVHKVEAERIFVKFDPSFHRTFIPGERHSNQFTFSRTLLKRVHRGIEILGSDLGKVLPLIFPSEADSNLKSVDFKQNHAIRNLNDKQNVAVQAIVSRSHGSAPFMLFGPPGTGKTTTMVEAIIAYSKMNQGKILVMAPSNNAADYLCYKLSTVFGPSQMFRVHAFQRPIQSLTFANVIMKHSFVNVDGHFDLPPNIKCFRVVVSTCASASYAWDSGLDAASNNGKPYFDAIFVDEAGHATEPEFWSSVSCFVEGIDSSKYPVPSLIIAGDPRQLGPVIRSPLAIKMKFDISYMERLIENVAMYKERDDGFDERVVVKLTNNYRSHSEILNMYSNLFYRGELINCADPVSSNAFVGWEELSNPCMPIQFHGVVGCDEREGNSPSWMNLDEIQLVLQYVALILASKGRGISPQSIGIITPYRKQVQKIRQALNKKPEYDGIMVGTCEQFQGQEKSVIIISTVRSSTEHLKSDLKFNLGFLFNPKRFNVAISRAKAMIIAIGNPHVLIRDPNWKYLLDLCRENDSLIGEKPPVDELAVDEVQEENIGNEEDEGDDHAVEAEWEIIR